MLLKFVKRVNPCIINSKKFSSSCYVQANKSVYDFNTLAYLDIKINGEFTKHNIDNLDSLLNRMPFGFRLRDLRSSDRQISNILARETYFLVIVEHLMGIVTKDSLILFRANSENVVQFANHLSINLQKNNDVLMKSLTPNYVDSNAFELIVLDEMLNAVIEEFQVRLVLLSAVVNSMLTDITTWSSEGKYQEDSLLKLVPMNRSLQTFQNDVKELHSVLDTLLHTDEDLNKMCLSFPGRKERMEVEMLIENFAKQTEELLNEISELGENISASKKVLELAMSSTRNYLMKLNLHISLTALTFASGSAIASIFGMNLIHGFESQPNAFYSTVFFIISISSCLYLGYARYYFTRKKEFHQMSSSAMSNPFFDRVNSLKYVRSLVKDKETLLQTLEDHSGCKLDQEDSDKLFDLIMKAEKNYLDKKQNNL